MFAQRFDFRINNKYRIANVIVDPDGERFETVSPLQATLVSRNAIQFSQEAPLAQKQTRESIKLQFQKSKFYFQIRVDALHGKVNPRVCFGLCQADFLVNQDLSKQQNVWCLNLNTGDVYHNRKWREYLDLDEEVYKPKLKQRVKVNQITEGTILGCLLDMDRGLVNFYKNGKDLGQAFCQPSLQKGPFFPFIQAFQVCKLSIFHPSVYPHFKDPQQANEMKEPEPQPRRSSGVKNKKVRPEPTTVRQSYRYMRQSLTRK